MVGGRHGGSRFADGTRGASASAGRRRGGRGRRRVAQRPRHGADDQLPGCGGGSLWSVARLSIQASTASADTVRPAAASARATASNAASVARRRWRAAGRPGPSVWRSTTGTGMSMGTNLIDHGVRGEGCASVAPISRRHDSGLHVSPDYRCSRIDSVIPPRRACHNRVYPPTVRTRPGRLATSDELRRPVQPVAGPQKHALYHFTHVLVWQAQAPTWGTIAVER